MIKGPRLSNVYHFGSFFLLSKHLNSICILYIRFIVHCLVQLKHGATMGDASSYGVTNILISTSIKYSLSSQCECNFAIRWYLLHPSQACLKMYHYVKHIRFQYFWFGRFLYSVQLKNETEFKPTTQRSSAGYIVPVYTVHNTDASLQRWESMFLGNLLFYRIEFHSKSNAPPLDDQSTWLNRSALLDLGYN